MASDYNNYISWLDYLWVFTCYTELLIIYTAKIIGIYHILGQGTKLRGPARGLRQEGGVGGRGSALLLPPQPQSPHCGSEQLCLVHDDDSTGVQRDGVEGKERERERRDSNERLLPVFKIWRRTALKHYANQSWLTLD